jgi:hypothetical protein
MTILLAASKHAQRYAVCGIALLCFGVGHAQEGFPLDGTWRGTWQADTPNAAVFVVIMKWDGSRINGLINPGLNSIEFAQAELVPSEWRVSFSAVAPDGGEIRFDGTLTDIGSYNRRIIGTWTQDGRQGAIELIRE